MAGITPETLFDLYQNGQISEDFYNKYKQTVDENNSAPKAMEDTVKDMSQRMATTPAAIQPIAMATPEEKKAMLDEVKSDPAGILPGTETSSRPPSGPIVPPFSQGSETADRAPRPMAPGSSFQLNMQTQGPLGNPLSPNGLPSQLRTPMPEAPYAGGNPNLGAKNPGQWLSQNEVAREHELFRRSDATGALDAADAERDATFLQQVQQKQQEAWQEQERLINERRRFQEDSFAKQQELQNKLFDETKAAGNMKLDPNKLWNEASTAQKVFGAIALLFGSAAAGSSGRQNEALGVLNNAINRDLQAQMFAIENKKDSLSKQGTLLKQNWELFKDKDTAMAASRVDALGQVERQIQSLMTGKASEDAKAQGGKILERIQQEKADAIFQFNSLADQRAQAYAAQQAQLRAQAAAAAAAAKNKMAEAMREENKTRMKDGKQPLTLAEFAPIYVGMGGKVDHTANDPASAKDLRERQVVVERSDGTSEMFEARSAKDADEMAKVAQSRRRAQEIIEKMNKIISETGPELIGRRADELDQLRGAALTEVKNIYSYGGQFAAHEVELASKLIPDPTSILEWSKRDSGERIIQRNQAFLGMLNRGAEDAYRTLGVASKVKPSPGDLGIRPGSAGGTSIVGADPIDMKTGREESKERVISAKPKTRAEQAEEARKQRGF